MEFWVRNFRKLCEPEVRVLIDAGLVLYGSETGDLHVMLTSDHLRIDFNYDPQDHVWADVAPMVIGTVRPRFDLVTELEALGERFDFPVGLSRNDKGTFVLSVIGEPADAAVRVWTRLLSDAARRHLDELEKSMESRRPKLSTDISGLSTEWA